MKKVKIDRFLVGEKGRIFEVLEFPFVKYMWAFDDHPEENCLMVDGCAEAFCQMRYAFAILAEYPDKLIYFPCRQAGIGRYYPQNYDLVLCRPELQFKRSLWVDVKRQLDKRHSAGKYVYCYDRRKLDDYYEKGLWKHYRMDEYESYYSRVNECECYSWRAGRKKLPGYVEDNMRKEHVEEILGNTVFMVLNRTQCYDWHYHTAKDLDGYEAGEDILRTCSSIGWILSESVIGDMHREASEKNV